MDFETGGNPNGALVQASDGKLYGLDNSGLGFIYSFDPVNAVYTRLIGFDISNGEFPNGSLLQASNGKLYGCTSNGGAANYGVIFSYDPVTNMLTNVKDFYFGDGSHPLGNLVQASDGLIYGVTEAGGSNDFGVIFSFDPTTLTFTKLQDFDEKNGANPSGGLMQASDGKLYGSAGILYSYDLATAALNFDSTIGVRTIEEFIELNGCAKQATFYKDSDTDGFGDPGKKLTACTQPEGYVTDSTDCDDNNPDVTAGAKYYRDADGDGYGDSNNGIVACTRPAGYVSDNTDCDDTDKRSHGPVTYYRDADGDHLGDAEVSITICGTPPDGYVRNNFDCDDRHCSYGLWNLELKMCHDGESECVRFIDIFKKLHHGWKLGACVDPNSIASRNMSRSAYRKTSKQALRPQFSLSNYPNPFTGSSTIRYQLPVDSKVSIKVYDALGRALTTLVDEYKKAGNYSVTFNAGRFSAGALYYRIIARSSTEQFEQTNKMILVR